MPKLTEKTTICFEPDMFEYLRAKAAEENRSISDIIHEAVSLLISEDAGDITNLDAQCRA